MIFDIRMSIDQCSLKIGVTPTTVKQESNPYHADTDALLDCDETYADADFPVFPDNALFAIQCISEEFSSHFRRTLDRYCLAV